MGGVGEVLALAMRMRRRRSVTTTTISHMIPFCLRCKRDALLASAMQYYVHVAEYGWRRPPVGSGSKKSKEDKNRAVEEWKSEARSSKLKGDARCARHFQQLPSLVAS